eukprot:bmy_18465T0
MGVHRDLYSGDIPRALREGTVVVVFQTETKPTRENFEKPEITSHLATAVITFKDVWNCRQVPKELDKSLNRSLIHTKTLLLSFLNTYMLTWILIQVKTLCHIHQYISININMPDKLKKISAVHCHSEFQDSTSPLCFSETLHPPCHAIAHFAACQFSACRKKSGQLLLDSWKNRATLEPNNFVSKGSGEENLLPCVEFSGTKKGLTDKPNPEIQVTCVAKHVCPVGAAAASGILQHLETDLFPRFTTASPSSGLGQITILWAHCLDKQVLASFLTGLAHVQRAAPKSLGAQVAKPHNVQGGDLQGNVGAEWLSVVCATWSHPEAEAILPSAPPKSFFDK